MTSASTAIPKIRRPSQGRSSDFYLVMLGKSGLVYALLLWAAKELVTMELVHVLRKQSKVKTIVLNVVVPPKRFY